MATQNTQTSKEQNAQTQKELSLSPTINKNIPAKQELFPTNIGTRRPKDAPRFKAKSLI